MKYDIYLEGTVGYSISTSYVRYLLNEHKGKHVNVRLSSLGGDVFTALNIYSLFKEHGDVTVYLVGAAASAATIIACGAKTIKIDSACMFLVHKCSSIVFEWDSMNEEEIGALIEKLEKQKEDQKSVDQVIANIYSRRNGKSVEDNIAIMAKAAWLTSDKAKEYGLVDEIYEVNDGEEKTLSNQFRNSIEPLYNKGVGKQPETNIVGNDGEPTDSFIQKTLDKVTSLFRSNQAQNQSQKMLKIFSVINAILGVEGLDQHEDKVILTQDNVKTLESTITDLRAQIRTKDDKVTGLQGQIDNLNNQVTEKDNTISGLNDRIAILEDAPGDETREVHGEEEGDYDAFAEGRKLFDSIENC